jgi:hypothetical protein
MVAVQHAGGCAKVRAAANSVKSPKPKRIGRRIMGLTYVVARRLASYR